MWPPMKISKQPSSRAAAAAPAVPVTKTARRAKKSIYQHQAPEVGALFAAAGRPERVAIVAIDYAKKEHADLIVISSHGYGFLKHLLLGSVAERIVRLAHCPVLVLRT